MQRYGTGSYVCWQCLSRSSRDFRPKASLVSRPASVTASRSLGGNTVAARHRTYATFVHHEQAAGKGKNRKSSQGVLNSPFRDQLREWMEQNDPGINSQVSARPHDTGAESRTRNNLTRTVLVDEIAPDSEGSETVFDQVHADADGSLDTETPTADIRPGDLMSFLPMDSRLPVLSVFLGYINGYFHFFSVTGKWWVMPNVKPNFTVRRFATEEELKPVIDQIPKSQLSLKELRDMDRKKLGPDRLAAASVLQKMVEFQRASSEILQKMAVKFAQAHDIMSEGGRKYATLREIHDALIGDGSQEWRPPPPAALYAVYCIIVENDIGFQLRDHLGETQDWLFEIASKDDVDLIQNMQTLIRLFTDIPLKVGTALPDLTTNQLQQTQLGRFIVKAREAIEESREFRDWTPHGMLGPCTQPRKPSRTAWNDIDMSILHFMLLWAGYERFAPGSSFHWIGSAILRATGYYTESDYLDTATAWTFLQEVGFVTPWDIPRRWAHRLADVRPSRQGGFVPLAVGPNGLSSYLKKSDVLENMRQERPDLRAFAIDSKDTVDVDDAVSIEPADAPGEHWVHIHVADPASRIRHQSALGERASLTPLTVYLSGHYANMWGMQDELAQLFSLGPGKPSLTFSGRVNEEGDLLECKIAPTKLQQYIYMTPDEANAAVDLPADRTKLHASPSEAFVVGKPAQEAPPNRQMSTASELRQEDLDALRTLYRIADKLQEKRRASGALTTFPALPVATASFEHTSIQRTDLGILTCNGDPTIKISWESTQSPMITQTMQLAGNIAARWCADRGVPVPFATQTGGLENMDEARTFAEKVCYPALERNDVDCYTHWQRLRTLIGHDTLSTTPGPQFLMGLDVYTKVTSPLRRYTDLLTHWQIENALLQEMQTGKVVAQKLVFSSRELERDVFPLLMVRQRILRRLMRSSDRYILQALLRAWKYPDSSIAPGCPRLPDTFKLTVKTVLALVGANAASRKAARGSLHWFDLPAFLSADNLAALGLKLKDLQPRDVLEVKLVDVNVYSGDITVEAVGKVYVQSEDGVAASPES